MGYNLDMKSRHELKQIAWGVGIPVRPGMDKFEIIREIRLRLQQGYRDKAKGLREKAKSEKMIDISPTVNLQ